MLKDGTQWEGTSFGAPTTASGEVVFNTGMVGYPETLTDPSYRGQIIVLTYPLIGNYGVPDPVFFESERIHARGLVVAGYTEEYSHFEAVRSLSVWLKAEGVPAIFGVDTRAITRVLREKGAMLGALVQENAHRPQRFYNPGPENLVAEVSTNAPVLYEPTRRTKKERRVILVDCGTKSNIIRSLTARGASVLQVPWDYDFSREEHDGVVISNGPGDPMRARAAIRNIRAALAREKPILGICLGNQLMALAAGGVTYKLPYGHRGHNQPVIESGTGRAFITSQNHGYAVREGSLSREWESWFTNVNDGTNEGIRHRDKPVRAVQFHPEASPGPTDTAFLFDEFLNLL